MTKLTTTPHYGGCQTRRLRFVQHLKSSNTELSFQLSSIPISISLLVWQRWRWTEQKREKDWEKQDRIEYHSTRQEMGRRCRALWYDGRLGWHGRCMSPEQPRLWLGIRTTRKLPISPERVKFIGAHNRSRYNWTDSKSWKLSLLSYLCSYSQIIASSMTKWSKFCLRCLLLCYVFLEVSNFSVY